MGDAKGGRAPKGTAAPSIPTWPDLSRPRRVHIIGIGGSGMSAIAGVLLAMGHQVSGSDAADSDRLQRLAAIGAQVYVGHEPGRIGDADVVTASTAIPFDDVEVIEAGNRGLRVWRRAQTLAAICRARRTVAVSGTHGKTSTSAMLAVILRHAGLQPSYIVGGDVVGLGSGAAWESGGEWLVVEADESDGTFLELGAEAVVVTSVEPDHLDFYGDEGALRQAFLRFVEAAPGPRVVCADDPGARSLLGRTDLDGSRPACAAAERAGGGGTSGPATTYGTSAAASIRIVDVALGRTSSTFSVQAGGTRLVTVELGVPGLHNVRNVVAALTMAQALGVAWKDGATGLESYRGVGRRFERRGERHGITFVDDYGHLPGEVAAMVGAVTGQWSRVVAVFQPHRYSRTTALWPDFADAFQGADVVLVTDIYSAGEASRPGVTGRLIADAVAKAHPDADVRYVPTLDEVELELRRILRPGDLCLTLGAGDLTILPGRFLGPPGPPGGGGGGRGAGG